MLSALPKPTAALVLSALGKADFETGTLLLAMAAPTLILLLETQVYILAGDRNQQCLATLEEYLLGFCSLRTFPTEESYYFTAQTNLLSLGVSASNDCDWLF